MSAAPGRCLRLAAPACTVAALTFAVALACGKKAPLRLPEQRPAEHAARPRLSVGGGMLTLEFTVPSHRIFPEREEPWVLARILRRVAPEKEFVEVGTILETRGFAFGAPLTWNETAAAAGVSAYRVEFRDAARRRRALSEPVEIVWQAPLAAPTGLTASGDERAVALAWVAPDGATGETRYRVYRREAPGGTLENVTPEPIAGPRHTDARVQAAREYCYQVRAVHGAPAQRVEGPSSGEACVRTEDATPPPPPAQVRVTVTPGAFQILWDEVTASDLLGYRVYRAVDEGPLELLTRDPVPGTAYREQTGNAPAGTRYRYVVTAVDNSRRRNESAFSPAAEAAVASPATDRP